MAEGQRKTMTGRVMSDKMDKTVVVMVQTTTKHRLYKKIIRRSKRYPAHDAGDARPGPKTRPPTRAGPVPRRSLASAGTTCKGDMPNPPKAQVIMSNVRTTWFFLT